MASSDANSGGVAQTNSKRPNSRKKGGSVQGNGKTMGRYQPYDRGNGRVNWSMVTSILGFFVAIIINVLTVGWFAGSMNNELKNVQAQRNEDKMAYSRALDDIKSDFRAYRERTDAELRQSNKISADVEVIKNQILTMNATMQEVKSYVNSNIRASRPPGVIP